MKIEIINFKDVFCNGCIHKKNNLEVTKKIWQVGEDWDIKQKVAIAEIVSKKAKKILDYFIYFIIFKSKFK